MEDFEWIVLYPGRPGIILPKFLVGAPSNAAFMIVKKRPASGRSLVEREDKGWRGQRFAYSSSETSSGSEKSLTLVSSQ